MLVKRKQRSIVVDIFGVEDCHRTIVQDQPALFMPNGNDSVPRLALLILHNDEARIVGSNSQFPRYNIFHDCVRLNRQELLSELKGGGGGLGVRLRRRRHLKK